MCGEETATTSGTARRREWVNGHLCICRARRRCLKGVDSRSKRPSEFVSIDEESQHKIVHVFCLGKHPLEGFCQETILLPDATFDDFFRCVPPGTFTPDVWPQTHPCFLTRGVGHGGAA